MTVIAGVHHDALADLENIYEQGWQPPWNRARTCGYFAEGRAYRDSLAKMDLSLVCDRPEFELTEADIDYLAGKLG